MGCFDILDTNSIFIPGNVPSLKNSKVMTSRGIFPSKTVTKYLRSLGIQGFSSSKKEVKEYKTRDNIFRNVVRNYFADSEYPILLYTHFVRDSKRKCDFNNMTQIIADLLTAHDYIPDDDMDHLFFVPWLINSKFYSVDKHNPGVYLQKMNYNEM